MNLDIKDFKKERTVYISEEINSSSVSSIKKDLKTIMDDDLSVMQNNIKELNKIGEWAGSHYAKNTPYPEIILDITSPGGSVYHGLGLYDFIRNINKEGAWHITCVANGFVASISTIIMLACDVRKALPNTSFLIHSLSGVEFGKLQDMRDYTEEAERLNTILCNIYTERTSLTKEKIDEVIKFKKDWWINTNEAYKIGLINTIED